MTLTTLGIKPIALKTSPENGFMPTVEDCRALITEKTKAIALVSPNNPTGAVYPHALLEDMFKLAQEHKVALILDETYRDFITGERPHTLFSKPWRTNLVHLYSFSKVPIDSKCSRCHFLTKLLLYSPIASRDSA